jgi:hypothetical protein
VSADRTVGDFDDVARLIASDLAAVLKTPNSLKLTFNGTGPRIMLACCG